MTEAETKKLIAVLMGAFPSTRSTEDTLRIYERMLSDLDYVVANAAVERLLATAKFLPTIAEIREACLALSSGEKTHGGEAWGAVLAAIRRFGSYRTPGIDFELGDPLVARCIAALGWQELCLSENQAADRARFIELYDKLASTERVKALSGSLPAHQRLEAVRQRELEAPQSAVVLRLADRLRGGS